MGAFVQLVSHPVIYFMTWEMLRFPYQFPIALENAAKSIELREPVKLVPILSSTFFHEIPNLWYLLPQRKCMAFPVNFPQHQFQTRAGTKSKIYQKKKRVWMLFYQQRGIHIYTFGKSITPYTKLSLLLIISSRNYSSYPKL